MRKMLFAASAFAVAAAAGAPASAQGAAASDKQAYEIGRCVVKSDRAVGAALLQSLPLGNEQLSLPGALSAAGECAKGASTVSSIALRGGIARALFLRDFDRFMVQPRVASQLFAQMKLPIDEAGAGGADARTVALYKLGDCVVRNEVMRIETLMRASVGSEQEEKLLDYLGPMMSACQGNAEPLRISRTALRSVLAQSAYNVSVRYWNKELYTAARR